MMPARIAVVHDWLEHWRGGEKVLGEILRLHPQAELFALVDFLPAALRDRVLGKHAHTSFLQRLPGARRGFRWLAPLFPRAIESLDVSGFDLVISSSHAAAKGVRTSPSQVHVCYCHTPMRYAWDLREQYLSTTGLGHGWKGALVRRQLDRLREWDRANSARVTTFVANSEHIRDRIRRCYDRAAAVVYPPIDTGFFTPALPSCEPAARTTFVTGSHWVPYKRMDLVVAAFRRMPDKRLIVTGDGPEARRIRDAAGPNVEFVGLVPEHRLRELLQGARAFVFAAEEDFGMLPVEAQACGTPVIAYGRGGVLETVIPLGKPRATGVLFGEQSVDAIIAAVAAFERDASIFSVRACRAHAERFDVTRFRAGFSDVVAGALRAADLPAAAPATAAQTADQNAGA
jgi:glycosyltransferase involved in cell wall biosynthesis